MNTMCDDTPTYQKAVNIVKQVPMWFSTADNLILGSFQLFIGTQDGSKWGGFSCY